MPYRQPNPNMAETELENESLSQRLRPLSKNVKLPFGRLYIRLVYKTGHTTLLGPLIQRRQNAVCPVGSQQAQHVVPMLFQCWSTTLAQHWINIGSAYCACWVSLISQVDM